MDDLHLLEWPNADRFGAGAAHLHAFGAVNLAYNRLEFNMSHIFDNVLRNHKDIADAIFERLSNSDRIDVLRMVVSARKFPIAVEECLLHAILCFELCTENRNTLMHIIHDHQIEPRDVLMGKKKNSAKTRDNFYSLPIEAVRKIADEILATNDFATGISMFMFREWLEAHEERPGEEIIRELMSKVGPNTLPDRPPRPDKLIPLQLSSEP